MIMKGSMSLRVITMRCGLRGAISQVSPAWWEWVTGRGVPYFIPLETSRGTDEGETIVTEGLRALLSSSFTAR